MNRSNNSRLWTRVRSAGARFVGVGSFLLVGVSAALAQPAPVNGPRQVDPRWHAIVNATLVPEPGRMIEDATIVIRDGIVRSVEAGGAPPRGARVHDAEGLWVYAGFIDPHVPVEAPAIPEDEPGAHWNDKVTPQRRALQGEGLDDKTRTALREMGFTAVAIAPKEGVFRGRAGVVSLDEPADVTSASTPPVIADGVYQEVAFESGGFGSGNYPGSQMGAIALIRQTLLDAQWRAENKRIADRHPDEHEPLEPSDALEALDPTDRAQPPLLFNVDDELEALRAIKIADEFDRDRIILGSGTEFRRLPALAEAGDPIIIPLEFPGAPDVASVGAIQAVELRELMSWEQAPTNPRRLREAGLRVALTTDKLEKRGSFMKNLRLAMAHGLTEEDALAMLTTEPARILGVEDRLGSVREGRLAHLIVADKPIFEKDAVIRDVWVGGRRHVINEPPAVEFVGEWAFTYPEAPDRSGVLVIKEGRRGGLTVAIKPDAAQDDAEGEEEKAKPLKGRDVELFGERLSYIIDVPEGGSTVVTANLERDALHGVSVIPSGQAYQWRAQRVGEDDVSAGDEPDADAEEGEEEDAEEKTDKSARRAEGVPESYAYPLGAFGLDAPPEPEDVLVTNVTIWTAGPDGVIEDGELEVRDGEIAYVGPKRRGASSRGLRVIDGQGRHVSPGLIDCHSHTGISGGVNEGTQATTCEVRIADVINPDDIDWYRQLAGGLTMANQLHGSANPIGGQNSVVKIRWGADRPDDMRFADAPEGVKFALGENVKQVHWGSGSTRYPKSRMGVETLIRDRFVAAQEYAEQWRRYRDAPSGERTRMKKPRRDLELDALVEILDGRRLVHCHSYRQDGILMLCRVAQDFGFTIGTFQHVLEGYKVADAIREAALGASAFSDWWAYKHEAYDAIPQAGPIMREAGMVVSYNSDSDELARRMTGEAAKAAKYGDMEPNEALKFVTLNAAIQLGMEEHVGSLERGKDADFVIWSGPPLSSLSRCESTWIDGAEYFSLEADAELREKAEAERTRIIQKILTLDRSDAPVARDRDEPKEDLIDPVFRDGAEPSLEDLRRAALEQHYLDLLRAGIDPESSQCGQCGHIHGSHVYFK